MRNHVLHPANSLMGWWVNTAKWVLHRVFGGDGPCPEDAWWVATMAVTLWHGCSKSLLLWAWGNLPRSHLPTFHTQPVSPSSDYPCTGWNQVPNTASHPLANHSHCAPRQLHHRPHILPPNWPLWNRGKACTCGDLHWLVDLHAQQEKRLEEWW